MMKGSFTFKVCLGRRRLSLTRYVITQLGNPTHLSFWYDETNAQLIISPAEHDDLDAYEIQQCYWVNGTKHSCEIARIALLKALQYRLGWQEGTYFFEGTLTEVGDVPAAVFDLNDGKRVR